ncbi:MAG: BrnT family toxin, partial [Methylococcales bacterium]|nr:BrnT family toxin [Methylococcales bacterium]
MSKPYFEWDESKNIENLRKHGVSFNEAQFVFMDENRVIAEDLTHSQDESRDYCFGLNQDKTGVLTVRFTYRSEC